VSDPDLTRLSTVKRAALALEDMRTRLETLESARCEPIAVVGLGCRLPGGADSPAAYWTLLREGREGVCEVPADRWDADTFYDPDPDSPAKMNTKWGGFLECIDEFDADFFEMSPREVEQIDPQQRLFLEVAWEALEDAGLCPGRRGPVSAGVFLGATSWDYALLQGLCRATDPFMLAGSAHSAFAGRLSYLLDLRGPSLAVDTACSSSLVASHLACQSLRLRECDLALAGAVNVILSPEITVAFSRGGFMAPDGRCKAFDARADGYVRGEGCGVVVLKRLSDAQRDGDRIWALIRGSAVNQDGASTALTAPNLAAQQALLRSALEAAGVAPDTIGYVEAHGTGTALGDPIEVEALKSVLGAPRVSGLPCLLGSVKSNLGHLEAAAGIAGLLKVVLALRHGQVPPHRNFKTLNPRISLDGTPLEVATRLRAWARGDAPRRAGVSAFSFCGTNAHLVLEEAPLAPEAARAPAPPYPLVLSARSPEALRELARRHREPLTRLDERGNDAPLDDIAWTLCTRRTHHPHRLAVVADDAADAVRRIDAFLAGDPEEGTATGVTDDHRHKLAFVFSGHGWQWLGMGQELWEREPIFRSTLEACDALFRDLQGEPLLPELWAAPDQSRLAQVPIAQPLLFAIQVGLAAVWQRHGVRPEAVVGHSVAEVAAAHVAGVLNLEDAMRVVVHRALVLDRTAESGRMLSAVMSEDEATRLLGNGGEVSLAAVNGPEAVVVSGANAPLEELERRLAERNVRTRWVDVRCASHSPLVETHRRELVERLAGIRPGPGQIPVYSTVEGRVLPGRAFDAAYWGRNLRESVRFAATLARMARDGCSAFVELSAHPVLVGSIQEILAAGGVTRTAVVGSLRRQHGEMRALREAMAALHAAGVGIDWAAAFPGDGRCVDLPSYPWQRRRFWGPRSIPEVAEAARGPLHRSRHPWLGARLELSEPSAEVWDTELSLASHPLLGDHRVEGVAVFPAAGFAELCRAAARAASGSGGVTLEDLRFERPLTLPEDTPVRVQVILTAEGPGRSRLRVTGRNTGGTWTLHATSRAAAGSAEPPASPEAAALWERCTRPVSSADLYAALAAGGLRYGPRFRTVMRLGVGRDEACAHLAGVDPDGYELHPSLLDGAFQVAAAALGERLGSGTWIPAGVASLAVWELPDPGRELLAWARLRLAPTDAAAGRLHADVTILDPDAGRVCAEAVGLELAVLAAATGVPDTDLYALRWEVAPPPDLEEAPADGAPCRWIVLADAGGVGEALAARLASVGDRCVVVAAGPSFRDHGDGRYTVRATEVDDLARVVRAAAGPGPLPCRGVVDLWPLDAPRFAASRLEDLWSSQAPGCLGAVAAVQALVRAGLRDVPRLWLVTRGVQSVTGDERDPSVAQAPLWGLGKAIAYEHPELEGRRVDLDPAADASASATLLAGELRSLQREPEVAWRDGRRLVSRLVRHRPEPLPRARRRLGSDAPFRLEVVRPGSVDHAILRESERRPPGRGEVEIRVEAAGLNFRDVLATLGVIPAGDRSIALGGEVAGVVSRVGEGVDALAPGDAVIALSPECGRWVTTSARLATPKPPSIDFEAAATLPIAFMTARHALIDLARLQPGERVLVHAAAGGVGQAAVQIARALGAEVHATAGTEAKRAWLHRQGVRFVYDSRTLEFATQVREATGGHGVDVVLNSLHGPAIEKGLEALAPYGRFLEIGLRDILENRPLGLRPFQKRLAYFAVEILDFLADRPEEGAALLRQVVGDVAAGRLTSLPCETFAVDRLADALRHMAAARHVGKVVLRFGEAPVEAAPRPEPVRSDGSYLITGGLGGLGLAVSRWLAERGARHLVLIGRSAPGPAAREAIRELEAAGAKVTVRSLDVCDGPGVSRLVDEIQASGVPLRGTVHAAGVLEDGLLLRQDREAIERVLRPKLLGAWALHEATRALDLDFFLLFSSAVTLLGSPGQGSYTAANAFLDALAHARRANGQAAQSIGWGPWAEIGLVADRRFLGLDSLTPEQGARALDRVLRDGSPHLGVMSLDLRQWYQLYPSLAELPLFAHLVEAPGAGVPDAAQTPVRSELVGLPTPAARRARLMTHLLQQVGRVLGRDPASLPSDRPLAELGFDSLMIVELRNRMERDLGVSLSAATIWGHPTLDQLAPELARRMDLDIEAPEDRLPAPAENAEQGDAYAGLSEEEIAALLSSEIADARGHES